MSHSCATLLLAGLLLLVLAEAASRGQPCTAGEHDKAARECLKKNETTKFGPPSFRATGVVQEYFLAVPVGDARNWSAYVHVPATLPPVTGVLFAYHGAGANGLFMSCYTGLWREADALGFLAIFPSASFASATANQSWPGSTLQPVLDDTSAVYEVNTAPYLAYFDKLLSIVLASPNVDPNRVFLTGVSNGGNMIALLSRLRAKVISGIAMVAGSYFVTTNITAPPDRPLDILVVHGSADPVVKYATIAQFLSAWAGWNKFQGSVTTSDYAHAAVLYNYTWSSDSDSRVQQVQQEQRVRMAHVKVEGGGHAWPCSDLAYGPPPQNFSCSHAVTTFFFKPSEF